MAEIEITLPTVQYGNVKVKATPEELGMKLSEPHDIGIATAVFLNLFQQGFRVGSQVDVSAPQGASQPVTEEQAQRMLDEGLGGVTEVDGQDPEGPGEEPSAPWDKPQVDSKPKPWETASAPAEKPVVDDAW